MEPKVNYTVVGLFVVMLLITLAFIIVSLTARGNHHRYQRYVVYMNESVSGLSEQSDVKYNGVRVGQVETITLNTNHPDKVKLVLDIDERYPIHYGTTATIETQGLTGLSYVGLRGGKPNSPILKAAGGEDYPRIPSRPSLLFSLNQTVHHIVGKVDTIADSIKSVLSDHNQAKVTQIVDNVAAITSNLNGNKQAINRILSHADMALANIARSSRDFPDITLHAKKSLQRLEQVLSQITVAANSANQTFAKGHDLLDTINRQLVPKFYDNLDNFADISLSLKSLSQELSQNPAILIRGKQLPSPGPGE